MGLVLDMDTTLERISALMSRYETGDIRIQTLSCCPKFLIKLKARPLSSYSSLLVGWSLVFHPVLLRDTEKEGLRKKQDLLFRSNPQSAES